MRKLTWFAGGFGIACLLFCYGLGTPAAAAAAFLLLVAGLLLRRGAAPKREESPDTRLLSGVRRLLYEGGRRLCALCLGLLLAFGWFVGWTALFAKPAEDLAGSTRTLSGTVLSYPEDTSIGGCSLTVRLDGDFPSPDVLLYGSAEWKDLKPGDRVSCTARLKASDRLYGDETSYYTARGIFLLAYCDDPPTVERADSIPLRFWPALCAHRLREGIYAAFDGVAAPLAAAVTLGDKSGLDESLSSALSRSGVSHAAVVSGMHISFLVSVVMLLWGGSRKAALWMIPLLLFYALMAGATPSALRAVIMQAALLAGPVLGREPDPPSSLGLALLLLLLQNPYAAASVSLQLSFGAVAGILLITEPLDRALRRPVRSRLQKHRALGAVLRWIIATLSVSLGAMIFTTPLIALYFGRISLAAPLTNLLVLWAVTGLTAAALVIGGLAIFLPGLMAVPGFIAGLLAHYIRAVVMAVGRLSLSALPVGFPVFLIWLAAVYLHIPVWLTARGRLRRVVLSLVCLALLLGGTVGLTVLSVRQADLTVMALDVGQGSSTLFLSGSDAILIDCGGNGSHSAGDTAADHLAAAGRRKLDLLVLTHLDSDHCNGVAQLFERLEVAAVAVPDVEGADLLLEMAVQEGARCLLVTDTEVFSFGQATLTLFPPLGKGTSNEEGLFALCSAGSFDVLITGDADGFVERMLVKYYGLPDIEVLMVGHHGARSSTCTELLEALRPELAVISVGYNSYGHPTDEVLTRLAQAGAKIRRTDENGTVTIRLKDGMISVQ